MIQLLLFDESELGRPGHKRVFRRTHTEVYTDQQMSLVLTEQRQVVMFTSSHTCSTCGFVEKFDRVGSRGWITTTHRDGTSYEVCGIDCFRITKGLASSGTDPARVHYVPSDPDGLMEIF